MPRNYKMLLFINLITFFCSILFYSNIRLALPNERYAETIIKNCENSNIFNQKLKSNQVFGSTSISTTDQLIRKFEFDVAIIDEASQLLLTSVLGPLTLSKKFILVGDVNQLPPIVSSKSKTIKNFSLFTKLLSKRDQSNTIELVRQFRMNERIMKIPNK